MEFSTPCPVGTVAMAEGRAIPTPGNADVLSLKKVKVSCREMSAMIGKSAAILTLENPASLRGVQMTAWVAERVTTRMVVATVKTMKQATRSMAHHVSSVAVQWIVMEGDLVSATGTMASVFARTDTLVKHVSRHLDVRHLPSTMMR